MKTLQEENYRLRKYEEAAKANLVDSTVNETRLKNSLTKAYKDVVRKQIFLNHCLFVCLFVCLGFYLITVCLVICLIFGGFSPF